MTVADLLGTPLPADLVQARSLEDVGIGWRKWLGMRVKIIDEYNRIPTRTQSALLTLMADRAPVPVVAQCELRSGQRLSRAGRAGLARHLEAVSGGALRRRRAAGTHRQQPAQQRKNRGSPCPRSSSWSARAVRPSAARSPRRR